MAQALLFSSLDLRLSHVSRGIDTAYRGGHCGGQLGSCESFEVLRWVLVWGGSGLQMPKLLELLALLIKRSLATRL